MTKVEHSQTQIILNDVQHYARPAVSKASEVPDFSDGSYN